MLEWIVGDNMQELQQIKDSLNINPNLNKNAKNTIFLLLQNMKNKMVQTYQLTLPTNLLIERLQTVSLFKSGEFINKDLYQYNIQENIIYLKMKEIKKEGISETYLLAQALLEMAYIKNPKKAERGIDGQEFVAIKKGTIEILANNLVGNDGERGISEDEQIFVNMANIITNGEISQAFLEQNDQKLRSVLLNKKYRLLGANGLANYNAVYSTKGDSQLGNVEMQLIDSFFRLPDEEVKEKLLQFEAHVISNPNVMSRPNKYNSLVSITSYFQSKKYMFQSQSINYSGFPNTSISSNIQYELYGEICELELGHSKLS